MLSQSDFRTSPSFALLLHGPPLSGKTNVAFQFPDPYFLDADDKLMNAVMRNKGKQFWFDCPLRKKGPDGQMVPVPDGMRWVEATARLKEAATSPLVKTIVIDSVTSLGTMLMEHILQQPSTAKTELKVGGIKVMDQSMWGPYRDLWTKLIMGLRSTGKYIVLIAHDVTDKDEITGALTWRPSFSGQLRDTGAGLFTDVWHCENKQAAGKDGQVSTCYFVRTQPTPRLALGNSLDLPAEFIFSWDAVQKRLDSLNTP